MSDVPVPAGVAREIHAADSEAVHAHPPCVVTVNRPLPPAVGKFCEVGFSENEHESAVCRTVTSWPATVTVPDRAPPVFAATATFTVVDPTPLAGDEINNHGALLAADQGHVGPRTTCTGWLLAAAAVSIVNGVTTGVQGGGDGSGFVPSPPPAAAACVTSNDLSAMV